MSLVSMTLPPGFRFHPTDDELVGYYLKRKVDGLKIELEVIPVIDLYKFNPWELPDQSFLPKRDKEWFFFCPRDRKYPNGSRTNRATRSGYWKATGRERKVVCETSVYGVRKTLVFYLGRAPGGDRTDWIMHEYRLYGDLSRGSSDFVGAFALCRVAKRNDRGQKSGNFGGEYRDKRGLSSPSPKGNLFNILNSMEENSSIAVDHFNSIISNGSTSISSGLENRREMEKEPVAVESDQQAIWRSDPASKNSTRKDTSDSMAHAYASSEEIYPLWNPFLSSGSVNFTEDAYLINELDGNGCLSSFSSPVHCIEMYSYSEDISHQSIDALEYSNASFIGTEIWSSVLPPSICRQSSEAEEANLWLQEDNMVIVI
ncbi:NAC domain-containing protein 55-like [Typha angustifolia]|uniref:NAC domain-containing protein 55-like n=1 Tax=Typha angustifolia TaxID=59011 RepID=UPI003C3065A3